MKYFGSATRRWFEYAFAAPTEVQQRGWERIAAGEHTLLIAPTGSGKTLAAFLYALDRLSTDPGFQIPVSGRMEVGGAGEVQATDPESVNRKPESARIERILQGDAGRSTYFCPSCQAVP
ncbi:MAG TPA: DEAD/DEAH box helicase [Longimicrobiales bacterium]|nr:DEAD/DEAH box helicase [Longimicrobiales bacterium]